MDKNTNVTKFVIQCIACDKEKQKHNTMCYVDWNKKYYMFTCLTCQTFEAFDEFGKPIELSKVRTKLQVN